MTAGRHDLDDQVRQERLVHVRSCTRTPVRDEVEGRTRYDTHGKHVCEHIARAVAAREYFKWDVASDDGAINQLRLVCPTCGEVADRDGAPPGGRWVACDSCAEEYSLKQGWPAFRELAPRYHETFRPWWERVGSRMAAVPPEVAEQWVHRHWGHSDFERLPILEMSFTREAWPLARVLEVRPGDRGYPQPDHRGAVPLKLHENWLGRRMRMDSTWPTPIIVLDNRSGHYRKLHEQQLIEGHTRLGYLRTLAAEGVAQPQHDVWVMHYHADAK